MSLAGLDGKPGLIVFMALAFTRVCSAEMCEFRDNSSLLGIAGPVVIT